VRRQGRIVFSFAAGFAQGAVGEAPTVVFRADTKMRIASVSKMADGQSRCASFSATPRACRILTSTAWRRPAARKAFLTPAMWRPAEADPPGSACKYTNFGYSLAAHFLERATNVRIDRLVAQSVLRGASLDCRFNWSGVPRARRQAGATLYAFEESIWQPKADGPAALAGASPAILSETGFDLANYVPGTNGTLFSPQGGLRASLLDMLTIARLAESHPGMGQPVWTHDQAGGADDMDAGYFSVFTAGAQLHPESESPIRRLKLPGHHGEAYGLYSAAFRSPELDAEFAFAVTGTKSGGAVRTEPYPAVVKATDPLWKSVAEIIGSGAI